MPGGDRTGPMGMGARTGRGLGYCSGFAAPGFAGFRPGMGRGMGFGRGPGRGFGPGFGRGYRWMAWQGPNPEYNPYAQVPMSREQEKQVLAGEAQQLKAALDNLEKRIAEIEKQEQSE